MPSSLILACLWVVAAAITAMLPMRYQYAPGVTLLILSIPLMVFVGMQVDWSWTVLILLAILSMFRRPLFYFASRARARIRGEA